MSERVLSTPLSGLEIRKAIADKVVQALGRDCYLSENLSYDYYDADIKISLTAHDVGRAAKVEMEVKDTQGEIGDDGHLEAAESDFHVDAEPPNTVRVESGQEVPVLTGDGQVKGAKYARNKTRIVK